MKDQRKTPRVSLRTDVWIGGQGLFVRSARQLSDLSEGGAFIVPGEGTVPKGVLEVKFTLPADDHEIICLATVRHAGDRGIGIQFLDISPADLARVRAFVRQQRTKG